MRVQTFATHLSPPKYIPPQEFCAHKNHIVRPYDRFFSNIRESTIDTLYVTFETPSRSISSFNCRVVLLHSAIFLRAEAFFQPLELFRNHQYKHLYERP